MASAYIPSRSAPVAEPIDAAAGLQLVDAPLPSRAWSPLNLSGAGRRWLMDIACVGLAAVVAASRSGLQMPGDLLWPLTFAALVIALLASRGLYQPRLDPRLLDTLRAIATLTTVAAALIVTLQVFVDRGADPTGQALLLWTVATTLLISSRVSLTFAERRVARACGEPTLIVGAGKVGQAVASRLLAHKELGLNPVGFLDKQPLVAQTADQDELPVLGASWDFDKIVAAHGIRNVVVTFSTAPTDVLVRLMNRCDQLGIRAMFVPRFFEKTTERVVVDRLGGLPLISARPANPRGLQFNAKYVLDRVAAAVTILLLSPILVGLALAVLITSGRPILYRQERIGRDGKRFGMLKFRSMRTAPDGPAASVVPLRSDMAPGGVEGVDRRTRLGTLLRKTSLDELPQLLNVLRGEMSFVGPRPERPEYVDMFAQTVHRYDERHRVKSGITGWAQVNGLRGKTSVADRAEWDNFYIENWSLWLDFKILLQTALAVACPGDVE
jgi:exopolysaccharide biosynthesis polyprenyl glycosylphosphotransferase